MGNQIAAIGAGLTVLGIILGAFGAHGLQNILDERSRLIYEKAVFYHLIDAVGLFAVGIALQVGMLSNRGAMIGAALLVLGIILFSGSLYIYAVSQIKVFAMITPFGGVSFIFGWAWLVKELLAGGKS